mmetsp:Transcript_18492/g.33336  ORF Transcript_18492/g.33336 Transcript_18492/m.33336 type:complete len:95 (+) Transcript_18492:1548-1832(+)
MARRSTKALTDKQTVKLSATASYELGRKAGRIFGNLLRTRPQLVVSLQCAGLMKAIIRQLKNSTETCTELGCPYCHCTLRGLEKFVTHMLKCMN